MIIHGQENTKPSVILNILKWLMRLTVLWNSWKTFSGAPAVFFFMAQMTQILLLSGMLLLERSKIIVSEGHLFKKKKLQWSFEFLSTLCKKVFSGATVKVIFVCASNNSDSVVFWNTALGDIKDHSLIMTRFEKKKIAVKVLGLCLLYIKRYFLEHQFSGFFFMAQVTQILLFSGMPLLERSKITVWEWQILKKNLLWKFWVCVYLT